MELIDKIAQVSAREALIHAGAVGKAITEYDLSGLKRGQNCAFHMVAAGGCEQKDFGFSRPAIRRAFEHQRPDLFGSFGTTGFARDNHVVTRGLKRFGQPLKLGRFPRPINTLKGDERAVAHVFEFPLGPKPEVLHQNRSCRAHPYRKPARSNSVFRNQRHAHFG